MPRVERICEHCGNRYGLDKPPSQVNHHYCSIVCSNKARALKSILCPICGKPFVSYGVGKRDGKKRTCSQECGRQQSAIVRLGQTRTYTEQQRLEIVTTYRVYGAIATAERYGMTVSAVRNLAYRKGATLAPAVYRRLVHGAAAKHMAESNPMWRPAVVAKVRRYWDNHSEERRALAVVAYQHNQRTSPSGLERRAAALLDALGVDYEHGAIIKSKFVVDFRIGNVILQMDGDYWHGHPRFEPLTERQLRQQSRDRSQDAYLAKCGYTVIRIWESDLTSELLIECLQRSGVSIGETSP